MFGPVSTRSLGMTHLRGGVQGAMVASERFPSGSAPLPSLLGPAKSRILGRDGMSGRFPPSSAPFRHCEASQMPWQSDRKIVTLQRIQRRI